MSFQYPIRLQLAHLPTPITKLRILPQTQNEPEIFLKRDDLTGSLLAGNKIRKLEFILADAREKKADILITCGGIQSNHARATAVIAAQLGMKSFLLLKGDKNTAIDGNYFIDHLMGAQFQLITQEQYENHRNTIMHDIANKLRQQGYTPYIIPEGASNELGVFGYIAATEEIIEQLKFYHLEIDAIVCATGSGGTIAGLILGKKIFQQHYKVYGINVCRDAAYFETEINKIISNVQIHYNIDINCTEDDISIIDGYVGNGYALSSPAEISFIKQFAQTHGIILDTVYTAKAMYGLVDLIQKGHFQKNHRILFLHSGGIFEIFSKKEMFL